MIWMWRWQVQVVRASDRDHITRICTLNDWTAIYTSRSIHRLVAKEDRTALATIQKNFSALLPSRPGALNALILREILSAFLFGIPISIEPGFNRN